MEEKHRGRLEQKVRTLTVVVLMLGVLATVAACRKSMVETDALPLAQTTPAVSPAPQPLPLEGWRILVDPGHGGYDGGARARDSGVWEKHINLAVALQVEKSLAARGAQVILTRREDEDLCEEERPPALTKKRQDMQNRIDMAVEQQADMVLSIHMNEYRNRRESGPQVFYRKGAEEGRLLAGCLQESLIAGLSPSKERAAMAGDYFILRLEKPSALVECGFISNAAEEAKLLSPDYQAKLGEAVARGVEEYVRLRPRSTSSPSGTPQAAAP